MLQLQGMNFVKKKQAKHSKIYQSQLTNVTFWPTEMNFAFVLECQKCSHPNPWEAGVEKGFFSKDIRKRRLDISDHFASLEKRYVTVNDFFMK